MHTAIDMLSYGNRYAFIDFVTKQQHVGGYYPWSPRRITIINTLNEMAFFLLGSIWYQTTGDPIIGWMNYVLMFSQLSHCIWYTEYGYNPGVAQTTFFMLPISIYGLYIIYRTYYHRVFFPKLAIVGVSGLAMMCAPWFIIRCVPGDYLFLTTEVLITLGYPLLVAKLLWPRLRALQAGSCRDRSVDSSEDESSMLEESSHLEEGVLKAAE